MNDPDNSFAIKLEGQATFLHHACETYGAVATALRRGAPDALAAKAAVASQWVARNHEEVGRTLEAAIAKANTARAEGPLATGIRKLPALRAEVAARLEQLMSTTVARAGGLEPLLTAAIRRSHLAWTRYERDWQLDGAVLRIPDCFKVVEVHQSRVIVSWATGLLRPRHPGTGGSGFRGRFELVGKELIVPSWLFWEKRVQLSAIRTTEFEIQRVRHFELVGTDTAGVEQPLLPISTLYDAEFVCAAICHFTSARRDSHWRR